MRLARTSSALVILGLAVLVVPTVSAESPGWLRTFDDNTFQGLVSWDYIHWAGGPPTFFPEIAKPCPACSPALRLKFTSDFDRAVGFTSDLNYVFTNDTGGVSAKVLIKTSTSEYMFKTPGQNTFFVAVAFNMDPLFSTDPSGSHFKGYWVYVGDQGANPNANPPTSHRLQMAIQYLDSTLSHDLCAGTGDITFDPFDPTKDWWMRGECLDDDMGNVIVRGRIWADGTPEPNIWHVECIDTDPTLKYRSGIVTVGGEQRIAGHPTPYTSFIDVDNFEARVPLDSYCPSHCSDPVCANHADCQCNTPAVDAAGSSGVGKGRGDGDVDMDDFAVFQICYTGAAENAIPADPVYCKCFDRPEPGFPKGNGKIDTTDFAAFVACATGPAVPWASSPDCPK